MTKQNLCNYEYDNELNNKINKRYFPTKELQPNFDPRPISTKYALLEISPQVNNSCDREILREYEKYDIHKTFFPGDAKGPVSYSLDTINIESELRNQYHEKRGYIPSIQSSLYKNKFENNNSTNYTTLRYNVKGTDNHKCNLAPNHFFNHTRMNIKKM